MSTTSLPTRRTLRVATLALVAGGLLAWSPPPALAGTITHEWTGSGAFTWQVPAGVTSITVEAVGGTGATQVTTPGGKGAHLVGTMAVTPGATINLRVAGDKSNFNDGFNGGGMPGFDPNGSSIGANWGGGATDIRIGGDSLANRVLVAGGGGGAAITSPPDQAFGGDAGLVGQSGKPGGKGIATYCGDPSGAAGGGTQVGPGAGGIGCSIYGNGSPGTGNVGGNGTQVPVGAVPGSGGGGGYFGGGGGSAYSGGGGGSSYAAPGVTLSVNELASTSPLIRISYPAAQQAITFITSPPAGAAIGGTYQLTAQGGGSGLPVTLTSASPACSVVDHGSGSATVSFLHAGSCVVSGHQAGNAEYDPAPVAQQTIAVARGAQKIMVTSKAPKKASVGKKYRVTATGGLSGSPVAVTVAPSKVCKASKTGVVTFRKAGTCRITVIQAGNADYLAAPSVVQKVKVRAPKR